MVNRCRSHKIMAAVPTFNKVGHTVWQIHLNCNENIQLSNSRSPKIRIFPRKAKSGFCKLVIRAVAAKPKLDFSDPDWKKQIQGDFEKRFNLPHLRDVIDVEPRPTTFSLKSRYTFPPLRISCCTKHHK